MNNQLSDNHPSDSQPVEESAVEPPPEPGVTPDNRWQRPPLEREKPLRSGWSGEGPRAGARPITETVDDTIRTAYRVIGENVRRGHDAAERYSPEPGRGTADASRDLGRLATRMIQLGREMATTYFDAMDLLLQEVDQRRGDREQPQAPRQDPAPPGRDDAGEPR